MTEEISNFATSAQSMLVSLANIVADLVRTSMSSDHSDGPFFHDSVLPQAVAPWQSSTHGHQEPLIEVEAFASQPLTSASMSGVTIAEPNISGAHSSLDRLSANNVVTSGMAPTDFFGPMRKPKPLRSALAAPRINRNALMTFSPHNQS